MYKYVHEHESSLIDMKKLDDFMTDMMMIS